jgi:ribonuclease D
MAQRTRPNPEFVASVKRLSMLVQKTAKELGMSPEILATRRELESIARGEADAEVLHGWRHGVVGRDLLAAR